MVCGYTSDGGGEIVREGNTWVAPVSFGGNAVVGVTHGYGFLRIEIICMLTYIYILKSLERKGNSYMSMIEWESNYISIWY